MGTILLAKIRHVIRSDPIRSGMWGVANIDPGWSWTCRLCGSGSGSGSGPVDNAGLDLDLDLHQPAVWSL